ncbi:MULTISPECIES: cbb3-type cytochrome c oxidase subunit 3 [unclassified Halomonas]|uniref:cbb3-type cytochrome oxidase subunit 3 n=1 Tax=unclassified Halomonas TaxID=2609666 RepID=UPI00209D4069|nr:MULTISPECIES: cbb3-type cytochrome c oxidase subunit 3 [unclassified Halomonas]MCP1315352.1 cbb3-type cytochrome c oxidase subunit 3 [Halomonas sp. 707D7]MCP1327117.1 cbb3-type cytochrome c oxidase subunit 3 [Halomonas sp. 707D4]
MDSGTLRGVITLILLLAFLGIVVWAYSRRRREAFDEAANLPFADDERDARQDEPGERP